MVYKAPDNLNCYHYLNVLPSAGGYMFDLFKFCKHFASINLTEKREQNCTLNTGCLKST